MKRSLVVEISSAQEISAERARPTCSLGMEEPSPRFRQRNSDCYHFIRMAQDQEGDLFLWQNPTPPTSHPSQMQSTRIVPQVRLNKNPSQTELMSPISINDFFSHASNLTAASRASLALLTRRPSDRQKIRILHQAASQIGRRC